ncbi:MAG: tyrosine-type recombinase/integrase [Planctomycetota bacterium]|jgi:integrase
MARPPAVHIRTTRQVRGKRYAEAHPEQATDLWVVIHAGGKRDREKIGPDTAANRERAEALAGDYRLALGAVRGGAAVVKPTLAEATDDYLRAGMALHGLAETTREDRRFQLAERGPLLAALGELRLDAVTPERLLGWWEAYIVERGRTRKTGRNYLDALAGVYSYAADRGIDASSPVDAVRAILRRRGRTKSARTEAQGPEPTPLERAEEVVRFVAVSLDWPRQARSRRRLTPHERVLLADIPVANLLLLDAGLREGEVFGLRWGRVWWGRGVDDVSRHLVIDEALARGRHAGAPKSGRTRRVALSRRLRRLLRERWLALGKPGDDCRVLVRRDPKKYRETHFRRVCAAAEIGPRAPKDLRDTYASQLLTAGVPLGYIAAQLGHAHPQVTARHYARWIDEEAGAWREPLQLEAGEVPADLLGRLVLERQVEEAGR